MPIDQAARRDEREIRSAAAARLMRFIPAALVIIYVAQCAWFIRTQSLTFDEPVHIAQGLDAWRNGRFEQYNDHPPLARLLCSLPLIGSKWNVQIAPEGFTATVMQPTAEAIAWRARSMNVLLGAALEIVFWIAARRFFSRSAANFALCLFVFSPALIAHFSLATTDGAATLMTFATAFAVVCWREQPTLRQVIVVGVALGLLLLAKFSTPVIFVVALIWMMIPVRGWTWLRNLRHAALALVIALVVVWAGYFFHVSHLKLADGELAVTFPHRSELIFRPVRTPVRLSLLVPAGEYLEGLRTVVRHNRRGQPAFWLGHISQTGGWKLYFPTVIALKWPTIVLVLFLAAVVLIAFRVIHVPGSMWVMGSFMAVYLFVSLFARFNLGDRHVLPAYTFALLFIAGLWELARRRQAVTVVLAVLLALNVVDVLRYTPDYLSYFTPFVQSAKAYTLLSDSNLDWGQGLIALRNYQRSHPQERISLAYFGTVGPEMYGISVHPLAEGERANGTVIVSSTHLSGQYLKDPESYHWLFQYPRTMILDHTLYVFQVDR